MFGMNEWKQLRKIYVHFILFLVLICIAFWIDANIILISFIGR